MDIQKLRRILEDLSFMNRRGLRYNFFRALEFQRALEEEADANKKCVSEEMQTND